jgi:hypothetical protein
MPQKHAQSTPPPPLKTRSIQSEGTITVRRIEIPREIKIAIGARIDAERSAQSNR